VNPTTSAPSVGGIDADYENAAGGLSYSVFIFWEYLGQLIFGVSERRHSDKKLSCGDQPWMLRANPCHCLYTALPDHIYLHTARRLKVPENVFSWLSVWRKDIRRRYFRAGIHIFLAEKSGNAIRGPSLNPSCYGSTIFGVYIGTDYHPRTVLQRNYLVRSLYLSVIKLLIFRRVMKIGFVCYLERTSIILFPLVNVSFRLPEYLNLYVGEFCTMNIMIFPSLPQFPHLVIVRRTVQLLTMTELNWARGTILARQHWVVVRF